MKVKYREAIRGLANFYFKEVRLNRVTCETPFERAALKKVGFPAMTITLGQAIPYIDSLDDATQLFIRQNQKICVVPIEDFSGRLFGFLIRSLTQKAFRTISGSPIFFYGMAALSGYNSRHPLIITEGLKEVEAIQQSGYKYALGYLTVFPTKKQVEIISRLSNNVILIPDRDIAGKRAKRMAKYKGWKCYLPPEKDLGILFDTVGSVSTVNFINTLMKALDHNLYL